MFGLANATVAEAFINLKKLDSANFYITRAGNHEKNIDQKVRYKYITAQINERIGNQDLALFYYQSIVKMNWNTQRKFWINSKRIGKKINKNNLFWIRKISKKYN